MPGSRASCRLPWNNRVAEGAGRGTCIRTPNASVLAAGRLLPAIAERHQQPGGTLVVPEVLRAWTGTAALRPRS